MARIDMVARSDDLGSSISANQAIDRVTRAGFIKNVSVMAPGPHVEAAAKLLAGRQDLCFGMHTTLNAEWDKVKWGPVIPLDETSGLVDAKGYFLSNPSMFASTKPAVEAIMREVAAQLEKLHTLGFAIQYLDSHMFPEMVIPGLDEAMEDFAKKKGLIDHMYFYNLPPGFQDFSGGLPAMTEALKTLPNGQYFFVTHPSLDTEEMRMTGNAEVRGEEVAKARAYETEVFSTPELVPMLAAMDCQGLRYDQALPQQRAKVEAFKHMSDYEQES
ncbi:ChbG/HpnK family deacetylase [Ohessyouella blattaphilus]|uniref:ChbG/HpnK family deacetylase n=1 Tax=Ohessyouella blattaphilus TaxID=2949333 RepID=A0ABT1EIA7_9FIRM|nr:ChbG/HpnK family deacetylase [Ohessyouella blattaphilus]MCP1110435.1 ChbG/HpnK family deacetylase [Ohessyouella blattaphilus]MCR8563829.1 ChbG/HpnK family deacetylase [Ohessyouella blattaphilus]